MDMDISQYKELFVSEASEHLDALNQSLLELERDPENPDVLTEIFRSAHTLKGMAATLGFDQLTELAHEMENVLDGLRAGDLVATPVILDVLFNCLDTLGVMVKSIAEDSPSIVDTRAIVEELRGIVEGQRYPVEEDHEPKARVRGKKAARARKRRAPRERKEPPEEEGLPLGEAGKIPPAAEAPEYPVETEAEPVRPARVSKEGPAGIHLLEEDLRLLARESVAGVNPYLIGINLDKDCVLKSVRVFMIFKKLSQIGKIVKSFPPVEDLEDEKFENYFEVAFLSAESDASIKKALTTIAEVESVDIALVEVPGVEEVPIQEVAVEEAAPVEVEHPVAPSMEAAAIRTQSVRVNITRLDNLMNLVGELVINRTRLMELASAYDIAELKETLAQTARLTADLQDEVMKTRMVPVENVFNRFPRMVRDLAKSQGKEVDFTIEGKEIELDRTILDEISDPLMHLLRNAVDHGIDNPDERERKGKPRRGSIKLLARRDRNYVSIEVSDDGQGIDREKVIEAAVARGLVPPDEKWGFSDDEVLRFLATPGFTTSHKVSGVSGRGVGLDVVKAKVESLGGMLVMTSTQGQGTTFAMKLPLTLAIIQALLVEVGGEIYAIPLGTVRETAMVSEHEVRYVQHQEVIFLRDETIPLLRLGRLLGIPQQSGGGTFPVVVVEINVRTMAIAVDDLLGQQEIVITSLDRFLKGIRGFAGATILGSGRVALILDIPSLI